MTNLNKFTRLHSASIPLDLCPQLKDINDAHEIVLMLSQDSLSELTLTMNYEQSNIVITQMIFTVLNKLKHLKTLKITAYSNSKLLQQSKDPQQTKVINDIKSGLPTKMD